MSNELLLQLSGQGRGGLRVGEGAGEVGVGGVGRGAGAVGGDPFAHCPDDGGDLC